MTVINSYNVTLGQSNMDFASRPTLVSLCSHVLEVAGYDASNNGCGISNIKAQQHSWVLLRMTLEWFCEPKAEQQISIKTWVSEVNKLMTNRNFVITDSKGKVIGGATTSWAMIDVQTRQAVDLREHTTYMNLVVDEPSIVVAARKLNAVSGDNCDKHKVCYSDMDFNNHCNTKRYIEWMCDMLPIESLANDYIKRFDVHFFRESLYNDTLAVSMAQSDNKSNFEIKNQDLTLICRASITM